MRPVRPLLLALAALAAVLLPVASASALPFPVTSTADTDAKGTLRGSIQEANVRPGADSIPIEVTGTIELTTALPAIEGDVAILGPGAGSLRIERLASAPFRIFDFGPGVTAFLSGVTVAGGADPQGGGIRNGSGSLTLTQVVVEGNQARAEGAPEVEVEGGGILSEGPLTVRESVIRDNSAIALDGGMLTSALGGGVMAFGPVTIDRSTISGNAAEAHGGGSKHSRARGGGLRVLGNPAIVDRSTVSGNSVVADLSLTNEARGGGLQGIGLNLTSSTVTGNSLFSIGTAAGANLDFENPTLVRNSIVAGAIGDAESCSAPEGSGGFNLDEDGSCGFGLATDLTGVAAGLDPVLRDNGGPTPTHALLGGSIAIDRGRSFLNPIDQRGFFRPVDFPAISNSEGGDGSDIGAFEVQFPPPNSILVRTAPGDRQPPNTRIVSGPARATFERLAKFRFASTEAQSSFQCKVDKRRWRGCASPFRRKVSAGFGAGRKHVFRVRAIDRFGNVDPTPARFGWRVKKIVG
ncbi:MAG: hypothetical protein M3Y75_06465 [Actinomycetota bacterium]|nr:hypothetical protein [Actinomycetota bacterium]